MRSDRTNVRGLSPALVGLVLGIPAAIPMYLWQMSVEIAGATFLVIAYTAWMWTHSYNHSITRAMLVSELRSLGVNSTARRINRMFADPGFWWNIVFGGTIVTGSVWYAGLKEQPWVIAGVAVAWVMVAGGLRYGLTLITPGTLCRRCGYNLSGHLLGAHEANTIVVCPECSTKWSRAQLGMEGSSAVDWRRKNAA